MRDLAVTFIVFASLPIILRRPDIGVLVWTWLSLMAPHRLTWGFAYDMPFAQIVGIVLLGGFLLSREPKRIPWSAITVIWAFFVVWMCVTTVFAFHPQDAIAGWEKSMKIQITSFMILMLMTTPKRLQAFVWVVALSIAFFGVKGGVFTVVGGGEERVYGPPGSFIEGNNELAMALIAVLPLMRFMQMHAPNKWVSRGLGLAMLLCAFSIIGSHSRGAFLGIGAMGLFLILKSRRRFVMLLALVVLIPVAVSMMPQKYWDRMNTIKTYEQDSSAMGRINAWMFAINLAKDNPATGGGFDTFSPYLFQRYAPDPTDFHDVHSIYFEVLAEQGIPGFSAFMALLILTYLTAGRTARRASRVEGAAWQADLARMTQVSLIGYGVSGAFLGLAYFDLLYNIFAMIVLNRWILERRLAGEDVDATATSRPGRMRTPPGIAPPPTYGPTPPHREAGR